MISSSNSNSAFLLLSDGTLFEGISFGYKDIVFGEVVFNTGITGYQEVITDPSYYGQLITFTYPEIGNTGINAEDQESDSPSIKGLIVREVTNKPSNWRSTSTFEKWLKLNKVVGIRGIDTRALVRHLRSTGSINGTICSQNNLDPRELFLKLKNLPSMKGSNLADKVSTEKPYLWNAVKTAKFDRRIVNNLNVPYSVVAIDFGIKRSILNRLVAHGCEVNVLPSTTSIEEILTYKPEGIFLSNGPGDPSAVNHGINLTKDLINKLELPMFGICLGHQILGLALGAHTFKLPFGHRGLNHPCGIKGRLEITSQNHGFAIDPESLPKDSVEVTHLNLNDGTVAGIAMVNRPVFGIQYHPEASPGPHDADHHFEYFVSLMEKTRKDVV